MYISFDMFTKATASINAIAVCECDPPLPLEDTIRESSVKNACSSTYAHTIPELHSKSQQREFLLS